jgi:hypothetical protein
MSKITPKFDFEEALEALKAGQDLNGKNGILAPFHQKSGSKLDCR